MFLFVKVFTETTFCEKNEIKIFGCESTHSKRDMMRFQGKRETSLQGLPFIKFLRATLSCCSFHRRLFFVCDLGLGVLIIKFSQLFFFLWPFKITSSSLKSSNFY